MILGQTFLLKRFCERLKKCFMKHDLLFVAFFYLTFLLLVFKESIGSVTLYGDFNFSFFLKKDWSDILYLWGGNNGGGWNLLFSLAIFPNVIFYLIRDLLNSVSFASFLYIFLFYFGFAFSFFILSRIIFKKKNSFFSLLIGLFAIFNPLIFSLHGQIDMAYSLLFLNVSIIFLFLMKDSSKNTWFLFSFFFIIFFSLGNLYFQNILLFLSCGILFILINLGQFHSIFRKLLLLVIIYVLVNFAWICPLFGSFLVENSLSSVVSNYDVKKEGLSVVKTMSSSIKTFNPFILLHQHPRQEKELLFWYSMPISLFFLFFVFAFIIYFTLLKSQKDRKIISLWMLILIFYPFSLGVKDFSNDIFLFFWNRVPFFNTFRSIHKFLFPIYFSYMILLIYAIQKFLSIYKKYSGFLLIFFTLGVFILGGSFFQENFKKILGKQNIPEYYYTIKKNFNPSIISSIKVIPEVNWYVTYSWGNKNVDSVNILPSFLSTPVFYNFATYVLDKNVIAFLNNQISKGLLNVSFYENREMKSILQLLSLLNIKFLIFQNDIFKEKIDSCYHASDLTSLLYERDKYGMLSVYEVPDNYFLPHFYIPQNIIYPNGKIENLPEIVGLPDYQLRSAIYLKDINGLTDLKINELKRRVDEVVVVGRLENGVDKDYFERLEGFKNNVTFPYVKHQPGSFGWKLARLKEKYEEWKVRKEPEKLIDKKLFFAGKRISEVEKFKDIKDIEYLILNTYKVKIEEAVKEIGKLGNLEVKKYQVIKLRAYLEKHREKINKLFINELTDSRLEAWERVFDELDGEIKKMEGRFDLNNLEYKLEIPKEGEYTIYLEIPNSQSQITSKFQISNYNNNEETKKLGSWEIEAIEIDGERVEEELEKEEQWVRVGKVKLGEGEHKLVLRLLEGKNLIGEDWQELKNETATESGKVRFLVQELFPQAENIVFQPIKNWEPGSAYYISFEYKTEGGSLGVSILEDIKDTGDIEYLSKTEKILDKKLKSWKIKKLENWEKFETILPADINTLGAKIYFYSQPEPNKIANVEFRNVKIEKIREPKIILRAKINNLYKTDIPKITFVKINPTKYRVKVEGAKNPYTLVFSESFHKGWKLYINELTDSRINELKNYGEIVASYFDGEIKEGTHRMTFLERATFETWGKKPIADDRHYLVNGYANSWYITPDDVGGKENYELIVEFWPQRLFYIGLFISIMTLIGCIIYLVIPLIKRVI